MYYNKMIKSINKTSSFKQTTPIKSVQLNGRRLIPSKSKIIPGSVFEFEIFAYCSKNYEDAYNFVIKSWLALPNVKKITIYTDWDLKSEYDRVEVCHMFEPSDDWIIGTGRRLNVIKDFSDKHRSKPINVLFLDIDCYIVKDPSDIFSANFDIAISRLNSTSHYSSMTATAGLWFCRMSNGYFNFIDAWFKEAEILKSKNVGMDKHRISYVQYSFTNVARRDTRNYEILPIDEKIYNSEHSDLTIWYDMIKQYKPKILHFKGRRFRDSTIVNKAFSITKDK